jgi:glycosyltransferase involved in cell wall biosynthesis
LSGQSSSPTFLSIVIPALNEAGRLPSTLERLHRYLSAQDYTWEIIVVSNGSTDGTEAVVREAAERIPNLELVTLRQRGKGVASRFGALRSRGDIVFLCDADLSMPPENLARFIEAMKSVDIVVGSREAPGAKRYDEPGYRHVMGRVFNTLVRLLAVPGVEDTQCGFKAFSRQAADELFDRQMITGFGFDVEILYLARKYGYRIAELGIEWHFNDDTRVRAGADTLNMVGELLMIRYRDLIGRYRRTLPATEGTTRAG